MVRKRSAAEWVLYKSFVNPLRNAALAVLSCLEVPPNNAPKHVFG